MLPWEETGVKGITAGKAPTWIKIPVSQSAETTATRRLAATLGATGALTGDLTVARTGQAALEWRTEAHSLDEKGRRKFLEERVDASLPLGATVRLISADGWDALDEPLRASFRIEIPDYAFSTPRRLLLPSVLFRLGTSGLLEHRSRVHPVYFSYPYDRTDELDITLPEGYSVEAASKETCVTAAPGGPPCARRPARAASGHERGCAW